MNDTTPCRRFPEEPLRKSGEILKRSEARPSSSGDNSNRTTPQAGTHWRFRRIASASFFIFLLGTVATAPAASSLEAATAPSPTAMEVIDRHLAAAGGRDGFAKIHSMILKGELEENGRALPVEVSFKAPGMILFTLQPSSETAAPDGANEAPPEPAPPSSPPSEHAAS